MNICFDLLFPPRLAMFLAVEHSILGVDFRQVPTTRILYLLWNVPIQIFAICYIILEVYNGLRYRKGSHSTLAKKLWNILGFHFYLKITTWLDVLLVNWSKLALMFY